MFKKLLLTSILTIAATTTFAMADGDKKVTSKNYVDTAVATRQEKITAGTTGNVVTYNGTTNGQAQFSERGIYDGTDEYDSSTDADKLVTAGVVKDGIDNLPTITTSELTCVNSPDCTLWQINERTPYGVNNLVPAGEMTFCASQNVSCSIDSDCCSGLTCTGGKCRYAE